MRRDRAVDIASGMLATDHPFPPGRAHPARLGRQSQLGQAVALAAAALCVLLLRLGAPAHAQSPMLQGWLAANTECKSGPPDAPKTQQACKRRDQVGERLKRRHCVYQQDGDWWKCPH
ncbi:MAG: hypothetical protein JO288_08415 [Hyphomicrobiales bacterium]|nr:hypothetical protein [Hyphomicrobiales bacterium]